MRIIAIESLADQIARYLEQQIVSGARIAGSRIVEAQVAAQLAVSRGSVREAMLLLQRRHLIRLAPRRAPEVSQLTAASANAQIALWHLLLRRSLGDAAPAAIASETPTLASQLQALASQPDNPYLQQWLDDMLPSLTRLMLRLQQHIGEPLAQYLPPLHGCYSEDVQTRLKYISQFCQHWQQLAARILATSGEQTAA